MIKQLHIEIYYADGVPINKDAEAAAIANINHWLKEVKDDIINEGGAVHYEIGVGDKYRLFLEKISNPLAERAFEELDKHRSRYSM